MNKITGTKEWAEKTINLYTGDCANACIYCYASANNRRFGKSSDKVLKGNLQTHNFRKRDYLTMYPSAHDIRVEDIEHHIRFLKNFLASGSPILIVSKPSLKVVDTLCRELNPFREQIEFRFTIGSSNSKVLEFFEPNAPSYEERYAAIIRASTLGYKVSLSIEPMLDNNPERIIEDARDFLKGDIWVGKMNHPTNRIVANGYRYKLNTTLELVKWQSDDVNILELVKRLSRYPNVRWKDSIQNVINKSKD
jgi:DNA repair photolyase